MAASTCNDWTSTSPSLDAACVAPQVVSGEWFGWDTTDCGQELQVYCFER